LVLLRHGQTDHNVERRMQGHFDAELTAEGLAQAAAVAPGIAALGPDRLISSDLRRAVDTAAVIGAAVGLDVKVDPRLRETHLGQWQGRTVADIEAEWPGAIAEWRSDPGWAPPGGESLAGLCRRVGGWMGALTGDRVLAVADATVVRAAAIVALGAGPGSCWHLDVGPGTIVRVQRHDGTWRLRAVRPSSEER
jgi:2,3-bisphosphoglycerate-dependent phosphoglycerate mutase/probable phosphoglycerate mutase